MLHAAAAGAPQPKPVPKWKAEHEEFMANLKAARQYDAAGVLPHPCRTRPSLFRPPTRLTPHAALLRVSGPHGLRAARKSRCCRGPLDLSSEHQGPPSGVKSGADPASIPVVEVKVRSPAGPA